MSTLERFEMAYSTVVCIAMVILAIRGLRRRRGKWTWHSTSRLIGTCVLGFSLCAAGLLMPERITVAGRDARTLIILGSVAVLSLGALVVAFGIGWLAFGDPTQPFPSVRRQHVPPERVSR